jgi:uncharacterized protein with HEPN domain
MRPERDDAAYLLDILAAAEAVSRFLQSKTREDFKRDEVLRSAIERKIEIIGEAARRVSQKFQEKHPQIPWQKIIATRHVLAHEYDEINEDIVWRIATVYVIELGNLVRPLIPPIPPDPAPE